MLPTTVPETHRINLGFMTINNLLSFDFMDPPQPQALLEAIEQLYSLGTLDEERLLTKLKTKMAEFPFLFTYEWELYVCLSLFVLQIVLA